MRILFDHGTSAPLRSVLTGRTIAIIVLGQAQWPVLRLHTALIVAAVTEATPGSFTEVDIPGD